MLPKLRESGDRPLNGAPLGADADLLGSPVFTADGKHVYCPVKNGVHWSMLRDGLLLGAPGEELGAAVFSADGEHVVFPVRNGTHWSMSRDGLPLGAPAD